MTTIPTGTFTLTEPVDNPNVDRRHKYDWTKAPVFKPGTYVVENNYEDRVRMLKHWVDDGLIKLNPSEIEEKAKEKIDYTIRRSKQRHTISQDNNPAAFRVLIKALIPRAVTSVKDWRALHKVSEWLLEATVQQLVEQGKITLDDLDAARENPLN